MNSPDKITGFHAHVYYKTGEERALASQIRDHVEANFEVTMGRWRESPVGPHPAPMFQISLPCTAFGALVPWLMLNRRGLSILVHPETGDSVPDHRDFPIWLGDKLDLDISFLKAGNTVA